MGAKKPLHRDPAWLVIIHNHAKRAEGSLDNLSTSPADPGRTFAGFSFSIFSIPKQKIHECGFFEIIF
jgi:hypothetical protein